MIIQCVSIEVLETDVRIFKVFFFKFSEWVLLIIVYTIQHNLKPLKYKKTWRCFQQNNLTDYRREMRITLYTYTPFQLNNPPTPSPPPPLSSAKEDLSTNV